MGADLCAETVETQATAGEQRAAAAGPEADLDLPQPFDVREAEALLMNSPFTRALNLSDSLVLTGLAYLEGRPVVTILDRATNESHVVSEVPNAEGWRLAEINASQVLDRTEIKIMVGGETVSVRYSEDQLAPKGTRPGGSGRSSGGPPRQDFRRFRTSSLLGEGGRDRYRALSDRARDQYRDTVRKRLEERPNDSQQEREAFARRVMSRLEQEDRRGGRR
jgi:hypothetical protein